MADLYITRAQPNPRGRDTSRYGAVSDAQLNNEWIEFQVAARRALTGDQLIHHTFDTRCFKTGAEELYKFGSLTLDAGHIVRVHTGRGTDGWIGGTYHVFMGYSWYKWNNGCGDTVTLAYNGSVIDSAYYNPNPPEGELARQYGTNLLR